MIKHNFSFRVEYLVTLLQNAEKYKSVLSQKLWIGKRHDLKLFPTNDATRYFIKNLHFFLSHVVFAYNVHRKKHDIPNMEGVDVLWNENLQILFFVWQKTKMYLTWIRKMMIVMALFCVTKTEGLEQEWTNFEGVDDEVWEWCVGCQIMIGSNMSC